MNKVPYSTIKDNLKTGDIVLFSGQYPISKTVQMLEGSKWSHVAMVVRLPEYEEPLLYEATALVNLPDLITGDKITGPKIVNLKERLETYGSDLVPYEPPLYSVRKLSGALPVDANDILLKTLKELHGLPNPDEWRMIYEVLLGRFLHIKTKLKDITCSGFIALSYERLGVLKGSMPINGYVPKDFSTDEKLKFVNHSFSDEILIDITK